MTVFRLFPAAVAFATLSISSTPAQDELEFKPRTVIPKRFAAIVDAPFVSAEKAGIEDNELVLGVTIGEHSRAYPINMLTRPTREIINDKLGDRAIAATW